MSGIVWLASYPRSGNTMLRIALRHLFGIESSSAYADVIEDRMAKIVGHVDMPSQIPERTIFVKTHELPSDALPCPNAPSIYIARDGRDTLVSHAHYLKEYEYRQEPIGEILRELILGEKWSRHVLAWLEHPSARLLRYENLICDPIGATKRVLETIGIEANEREGAKVPSFSELHAADAKFFRQGKVGGWREDMNEDLHRLFWERQGVAMRRLGIAP
jgi:hypothetical protein